MFRKPAAGETMARAVALLVLYPLDMWLFGWALAILGGPDISRLESLILVFAIHRVAATAAWTMRLSLERMIK